MPEVLLSANAMKAGMAILRPLLAATGAPKMGKMVIGTVKGDIHDIGKNLVCMMMEGAGFEVIDLGVNNGVDKYLEAIEKHQPDIVGMSALLTTTMPYMKVVIDTLKEKGIRNDYIVLVGGAPLNEILRRGDRRRRLLPRRGGRGRDGEGPARAPAGDGAGARESLRAAVTLAPAIRRGASRKRGPERRPKRPMRRRCDKRPRLMIWIPAFTGMTVAGSAPKSSSKQAIRAAARARAASSLSLAAPWRAKCWRSSSTPSMSPACRRNCTTIPSKSPARCGRRSAPIAKPTTRSSAFMAIAEPAASSIGCLGKSA